MTNTELAILSLIAEEPRYGYEIEQVIEQRGMRNWTEIGFSSIYYLLKKLETSGWIESFSEAAEGRGPARKVYRITPDGWKACLEGTLAALSKHQPATLPFMAGLSNLPMLETGQALQALHQYRQGLLARLEQVRSRAIQRDYPPHVGALFDLGLTLILAELQWIESFSDGFAQGEYRFSLLDGLDEKLTE